MQSYNTIELRYADSELAKHRFVKQDDVLNCLERTIDLLKENEILRAERSHWYHMYNQESGKMTLKTL